MRPVDIFLIPYFWLIFADFQNEAECLRINSLKKINTQSDYFSCHDLISGFNCRIQVEFLRSILWWLSYGSLNAYTFLLTRYLHSFAYTVHSRLKHKMPKHATDILILIKLG